MTNQPRPPEWWTSENTEAWTRERWANVETWDEAMRAWGSKYTQAPPKGTAALYRPLPPKVLQEWREGDPRPANPVFYDGRPQPYIRPLVQRKRRAVA